MGNSWKYLEWVLVQYFTNPLRAQRTYMEFEEQMAVKSEEQDNWPFVFGAILNAQENEGVTEFVIDLYAWDLITESRNNVVDVASDMHQMLRDFYKWLYEENDPYIVVTSALPQTTDALNNGLLDIAVGAVMRGLTLEVPSVDPCEIPGGEGGGGIECPAAIVKSSDGEYVLEAPSGEVTFLPDTVINITVNEAAPQTIVHPTLTDQTINITVSYG